MLLCCPCEPATDIGQIFWNTTQTTETAHGIIYLANICMAFKMFPNCSRGHWLILRTFYTTFDYHSAIILDRILGDIFALLNITLESHWFCSHIYYLRFPLWNYPWRFAWPMFIQQSGTASNVFQNRSTRQLSTQNKLFSNCLFFSGFQTFIDNLGWNGEKFVKFSRRKTTTNFERMSNRVSYDMHTRSPSSNNNWRIKTMHIIHMWSLIRPPSVEPFVLK